MGFRQGAFARIWSIEDKGKYYTGNMSTSRKKQDGSGYETDFQDGFVRFVGSAHEALNGVEIPKKGLAVKLSSCEVTNRYDPNTKKTYTNYAVFGIEIQDGSAKPANQQASAAPPAESNTPTDETNELPF